MSEFLKLLRSSRKAQHVTLAVLGLLVLMFAKHEIFGPSGYLMLRQKRQEYTHELKRQKELEAENQRLHQSIDALKGDPRRIEHIAREELHLTRPGEVVYTYPEATQPAANESARR